MVLRSVFSMAQREVRRAVPGVAASLVDQAFERMHKSLVAFPDFITFLRHHIAHNDNQRVT